MYDQSLPPSGMRGERERESPARAGAVGSEWPEPHVRAEASAQNPGRPGSTSPSGKWVEGSGWLTAQLFWLTRMSRDRRMLTCAHTLAHARMVTHVGTQCTSHRRTCSIDVHTMPCACVHVPHTCVCQTHAMWPHIDMYTCRCVHTTHTCDTDTQRDPQKHSRSQAPTLWAPAPKVPPFLHGPVGAQTCLQA